MALSIMLTYSTAISNYAMFEDRPTSVTLNVSTDAPTSGQLHDLLDYAIDDSSQLLKELRRKNIDRIILAHLNINSIRNKIILLTEFIGENIDIFLVSEIKIDKTFPTAQFLISGYSTPFRLDGTNYGEVCYCMLRIISLHSYWDIRILL